VEDALATECDFDGHVVVFDGGIELITDNTGPRWRTRSRSRHCTRSPMN
jgi:hypothetical protein